MNACDQIVREKVLKFLLAVKREKSKKKIIHISKRPKETKDWKWKEDIPGLTKTMAELTGEIETALQSAIETRGQYLRMAYEELDWAVHACAEARGSRVQDMYHGLVLVQRTFTDSPIST